MDWKNSVSGSKFIASFSGGKDSVLALYKAMKAGGSTRNDRHAGGRREMFQVPHGMPPELLRAQARSVDLPIL